MCGIAGFCLADPSAPVPEGVLHRMTDALAHRGPDGHGYLLKRSVGLGHRRLSIIDVAGGGQPIYNEDGSIGIVFNGEIYNYIELMDDLRARGHRFVTHSDTEVIVHLYEEYGEQCVDQLRGMFAFAIWDGRRHCVFIARDRLGIKPLFYYHDHTCFVFSSELKSLLAVPSIPRQLDPVALQEYLLYGYVPGDRCILNSLSKLAPGHTLTWCGGRIEIRQYWDVDFTVHPRFTDESYLEGLEAVLLEAVRIHLRSDVPLGVFLSGGIDSSTIVALSCLALSRPVKTFSVGFSEEDYSELATARTMAERYKTDHHEIIVQDRDIGVLSDIVWHLDEPFADPSALPTYFVCRAAREHVKVCLSGDGADELFGGYTRYRDALSLEWVDTLPRPARRALLGPLTAAMPQAMWGRGFLQRLGGDAVERYQGLIGVFPPKQAAGLLSRDIRPFAFAPTRILDSYFPSERGDTLTTMQHADQKTYLPDDILVKVDRMSMQNGLEVRPPFLDHKVTEFVNRCPPRLKMHDGIGKILLKRLMRDRVPFEILTRRKMGFGVPIKHWFRGSMKGFSEEMLLSPSSRTHSLLDQAAVRGILKSHGWNMRDSSRRIWSLLVLEQWCRSYRI
jgi:asparagine synthase (glutamine-hydrolysing)